MSRSYCTLEQPKLERPATLNRPGACFVKRFSQNILTIGLESHPDCLNSQCEGALLYRERLNLPASFSELNSTTMDSCKPKNPDSYVDLAVEGNNAWTGATFKFLSQQPFFRRNKEDPRTCLHQYLSHSLLEMSLDETDETLSICLHKRLHQSALKRHGARNQKLICMLSSALNRT